MRAVWIIGIAAIAAGGLYSGTRHGTTEPSKADIARAAELRPTNPAIAGIYERSCVACHATVDAQAPLVGFEAAWKPRLSERGEDGLVNSAMNGFGNMPAMGLCSDCTETEFRALIRFMSTGGDMQ